MGFESCKGKGSCLEEQEMTGVSAAAVTRLLNDAASGDPRAAGELLPLVYNELRRLARVAHLK